MRVDPEFKHLIVPLSEKERSLLEESIKRDGCRVPLDVWEEEGILLDGHNRFEICEEIGTEYKTNFVSLPDRTAAKIWILENQAGRRNLSKSQAAVLALDLEEQYAIRAKERQLSGLSQYSDVQKDTSVRAHGPERVDQKRASDEAAEVYGVGGRQVRRAKAVKTHAIPDLLDEVKAGNVTVRAAENVSRLSPDAQRVAISKGPVTVRNVSTVMNDLVKVERNAPGVTEKAVTKILTGVATSPKEAVDSAIAEDERLKELRQIREFNEDAIAKATEAGKAAVKRLGGKCVMPNVREWWCEDCEWGFDTYIPEPNGMVSCPYCGGKNIDRRDEGWYPNPMV